MNARAYVLTSVESCGESRHDANPPCGVLLSSCTLMRHAAQVNRQNPSQPNKLTQMIQSEITKFMSDPENLPDPFVSWMGSFITLTASSTGSITS